VQAAPVGTAVWLPGLGDRWPRHSRLCRLSAHAYLSSHLVVVGGGRGQGEGAAFAPTKFRLDLQPLREPQALSWASSLLPTLESFSVWACSELDLAMQTPRRAPSL
jgi:hypothetical protein